jgi:hypothetical protein
MLASDGMATDPRDMILSRRAKFVAAALAATTLAAADGGVLGDASTDGAPATDAGADATAAPIAPRPTLPAPRPLDGISESERAAARELARSATSLLSQKLYRDAVLRLRQAYVLYPHPRLLLPLADACEGVGSPTCAVEALSRYLAQEGAQLPDAKRVEIERRVAALRETFASVVITTNARDGEVTLDGERIASESLGAPLLVDPGEHVIDGSVHGSRHMRIVVALPAGGQREVMLDLTQGVLSPCLSPMPCLTPPMPCLQPPGPRPHACSCDVVGKK